VKTVLLFLGGMMALILGAIWGGFVLVVLWGWFIVPAFHVAQISIVLAIGINCIVRLLTYTIPAARQEDKEDAAKALTVALAWSFFYPLVVLGCGYVVHLFV